MSTSGQQPSTSATNNVLSTTNRPNQTPNSRLNCANCGQHSQVINKPIYYLPCLHIICHNCEDKLKTNPHNRFVVICPSCKRETSRELIYDDFIYEQARKKCEIPGCPNQTADAVFSKCITCTRFLCESCAREHDSMHHLTDASTYIPRNSRCSTKHTPNRPASFICACSQHLCSYCVHTHHCENRIITKISDIIKQATDLMNKTANNDRRIYANYVKTYENIQNRRRQVIAEFHNARSSLAHNITKSTSLLVHRFNDIREHLNMLQRNALSQLSVYEQAIGAEMRRLKEITVLEDQLQTIKDYNAFSIFAFVKAASTEAGLTCKHQNFNMDQHLPVLSIRVDGKTPEFCNFLNTMGSIQVNGTSSKPRTKFDSSVTPMFDVVPKINCTNTSKGYSVRMINGDKHVVVDQEEIKRKVKHLQNPDELKERYEQLENEVAYYKALASHLESELQNRPQPLDHPSTSKTTPLAHGAHAIPPRPQEKTSGWSDQNNHINRHNQTIHQQLMQLRQGQANTTTTMSNLRMPNNQNSHRHGSQMMMPGYPDPNVLYRQAVHGHQNAQTPSLFSVQVPPNVPGSPQITQNLPSSSNIQSPLTPNPMMGQNMMFSSRSSQIPVSEFQEQMLRNRPTNPPSISTTLISELVRNSLAQLSPTTPYMPPFPNITQFPRMQTSPAAPVASSRSGSISQMSDTLQFNSKDAGLNVHQQMTPFEVINISDDDDSPTKDETSNNNSNNPEFNKQSASLPNSTSENQAPSSNAAASHSASSNAVASNGTLNPKTPQASVSNIVLCPISHEAPVTNSDETPANLATDSTNNVSRIEDNAAVSSRNTSSSLNEQNEGSLTNIPVDEIPKHLETPDFRPDEGNPPIKLRLKLPANSHPIVTNKTKHHESSSKRNEDLDQDKTREQDQGDDEWDDFCFICNEGCDERSGDLGCCSGCPRVFHRFCHIPFCGKPMAELPDDWKCGICINLEPIRGIINGFPNNARLICSRIMLLCFNERRKKERQANFFDDQDNSACLIKISHKLSKNSYMKIPDFVTDMNNLFKNCSRYNAPDSAIADHGRAIFTIYQAGVQYYLPAYSNVVWLYVNLYKFEVPRKKRRLE